LFPLTAPNPNKNIKITINGHQFSIGDITVKIIDNKWSKFGHYWKMILLRFILWRVVYWLSEIAIDLAIQI
jgi:hypothetical protein